MIKKQDIKTIISYLDELFPNAETELNYETHFQLLVAIIMSAQTTDKQVNKATKEFFKVLKTPEDGVKLGESKIRNYIKSIGFFKNKAKYIFETSQILAKNDLKNFDSLEKLQTLPGVGVKTSKVYLAVTQNSQVLPVDTHIHRVLNRLGIVNTKTALQTDKKAEKYFSKEDLARLHHTLILFGRYKCKARKPDCKNCEIRNICKYFKNNQK